MTNSAGDEGCGRVEREVTQWPMRSEANCNCQLRVVSEWTDEHSRLHGHGNRKATALAGWQLLC